MRITSWNVNGLRAALRKGFEDHIQQINPDVLLLQEVRALPEQLPAQWQSPEGWHVHWHPAERKGYSGVAIWSRQPIEVMGTGIHKTDPEGRILHVRTQNVQLVSVYLPSGSNSEERQQLKEDLWMTDFLPWANPFLNQNEPVILGGDFNIAHTEQDIFYAKGNEKNSGFLPQERAWMTDLLAKGWTDFVRRHYGDVQGPYSWWSNRGNARELDRGWRIDYLLGNPAATARFQSASIHREGGLTVSDHAPVTIDLI
ncbi:MAG: exodeoxyribonuclease III [bacterium]|nr:exodeoxyribonuclease III [bacterium]